MMRVQRINIALMTGFELWRVVTVITNKGKLRIPQTNQVGGDFKAALIIITPDIDPEKVRVLVETVQSYGE